MLDVTQHGNVKAKDVLAAFTQYGFRKTSMEDIARAAGVSRQSIYKKFGSKDACYAWTVNAYLADMYGRIFAAMDKDDLPPFMTLRTVFDIFIGEAVELVRNPHGTELLDDAIKAAYSSDEDWPLRFRARLGAFLYRSGYAASTDEGVEKAFALIAAGKGLLLEATTTERFRKDMKRVLEAVVGRSG